MGSEWKIFPTGELCTGIYDGPHATPKKTSDGPIFLGISNLSQGRIDLSNTEHLSEEDFIKWTRRITPQPGDVVFSYETRLGEVGLIPEGLKCCLGRRMALMRPNPSKADSRFLLYAYLSPEFQSTIRARTIHGSTVDRIPLIEFPSFPIRVPPLDEQKAIAQILGTLDDKIELNQQMNQTLEAIARALFKSWFIDFDPVRAKLDGRQPAGMDAETVALFPAEFEDSALGKIPKGWEVQTIGEVLELAYGKALKENIRCPGHIPVYGSNGQIGWHDKALVATHGIVIGRKGNPETVLWCPTAFFPIDTTFYVVLKEANLSLYCLMYALRSHDLPSLGADSAVPGLNRNLVYMNRLLVPSLKCLEIFDSQTEKLYKKNQINNEKSATLTLIRDALLPKLLSGEIRVQDAETVVEAVT